MELSDECTVQFVTECSVGLRDECLINTCGGFESERV
jgi:hypothetical protein